MNVSTKKRMKRKRGKQNANNDFIRYRHTEGH